MQIVEHTEGRGAGAGEPIADGIHFDLDEATYHRDLALGSSDLKRLYAEPADYWFSSPLNPALPPEETTPAQLVGKAVHKLVLEGEAAFSAAFEREATGSDVLRTDDDLAAFLVRECGVEKPPRGKAAKAAMIREICVCSPSLACPPILSEIEAAAEQAGRIILKAADFDRITAAAGQIAAHPHLNGAVTGGRSEVSVFWTETIDGEPVRRKARFDYLKPRAIVDLKSVAPRDVAPFPQTCRKAIANWNYATQAAAYLQARAQLAALAADGAIHGDHDPEWLGRVAAANDYAFVLVFWSSSGAPLTWGGSLSPGNRIVGLGEDQVKGALWSYVDARRRFGLDRPWITPEPLSEIDIEHMPPWFARG